MSLNESSSLGSLDIVGGVMLQFSLVIWTIFTIIVIRVFLLSFVILSFIFYVPESFLFLLYFEDNHYADIILVYKVDSYSSNCSLTLSNIPCVLYKTKVD